MTKIPHIPQEILTLITTYLCTSSCPNCCFSCSPHPLKPRKMALDEMTHYIQQAKEGFPELKVVVFTGGECTLLGKDLLDAIRYAKSLGLMTRIVTNGHWAHSEESASHYVSDLEEAGLDEINFSYGDEHARFVSMETLSNALGACVKSKTIRNVVVSIEHRTHAQITQEYIVKHLGLAGMSEAELRRILFLKSPWVEFRTRHTHELPDLETVVNRENGCSNVLNTITINPNGVFLSCCGLCCERIPFLKLGNLNKEDISVLNQRRFGDLMKLWLFTDGPLKILQNMGIGPEQRNLHECFYCQMLLGDKENVGRLLEIAPSKVNEIILNYHLKHHYYEGKFFEVPSC